MNRYLKYRPGDEIPGEYPLGSEYGEEEMLCVSSSIQDSSDPVQGFVAHRQVRIFEEEFAAYVGASHAIAVSSGGVATDMVLHALDLQSGDEVISCAINFVGTHLSIIHTGARLVLCDPDPLTLNIDPLDAASRITPKTRAIVVTHMNGLSADMAGLQAAIRQQCPDAGPIAIIGDAARSLGATYMGRKVGADGLATTFSFQSKKHITTLGEGGMIVTDNDDLAHRLRQFRSFGCGAGWGTNYKMTRVQAEVGSVQMKRLDDMILRRRKIAQQRHLWMKDLPGLQLPVDPIGYNHAFYLYSLLLPEGFRDEGRDRLRALLHKRYDVGAAIANRPTYLKNQLLSDLLHDQVTPVAENVGARLICLPVHPGMSDAVNGYVAAAFCQAYESLYSQYC